MTVVKFSILTLLAGGFCTLLGIGMWMGPQETPCNAQTDATAVAVAAKAQVLPSPYYLSDDVVYFPPSADSTTECSGSACDSVACVATACTGPACESGSCDLVATPAPVEPSAWQTQAPAPQAIVARIQTQGYSAYPPGSPCDSGVCTAPGAPWLPASPSPMGMHCPPGAPCPPMPTFATTAFYHVAPCTGADCPAPVYSHPYGVAQGYSMPAQAPSAYASYQEAELRSSDQPSMEMIEAFMEEREKRYEAQVEALQSEMELKLEAQEAMLKAEHQVEMIQLKAEAMVRFATMEQALREEKALLALVADGTLTTDALRAIIAKNHANGNGGSVQPVSVTSDSACSKCDQNEVSAVSADCKCEGDCCPACEQAVSIAAPNCSACKASACEASACKATACETPVCTASACAKCSDCKSCDATTVVNAEACEACAKSCEACVKACGDCKVAGTTLECDALTVSADGKTCTIVVGATVQGCKTGECKSGTCNAGDKSVAVETDAPFVCEKDGCQVEFHVTGDVPMLSNIPYLGRLFKNSSITEEKHEQAAPADEAKR